MAIDIFNPEISQVTKGIEGKMFLIYGTNSTGKTKNLAKAPNSIVCCFENGLSAINGIKNVKIKKWTDWIKFVKQLTSESTIDEAKKLYSTVIIDTVEGMGDLASEFICGNFGVARINEGNHGFGLWKEYGAEINRWLKLLTTAGYTVFFIAHEGERTFLNDKGEEYTKIFPRGDKRVIDSVCDAVDIIGYAQVQPNDKEGNEVYSTLYLKGTPNFHARSRFVYMPQKIEEWTLEKLDAALAQAIVDEEKKSGMKAITAKEALKKEEKAKAEEEKAKLPLNDMINTIGVKLQEMIAKEGSIDSYNNLLAQELGTQEFKATKATEAQRPQLEIILAGLANLGY